ncbi:MAG TPA: NADP-dependent oxidoreductase [Pseudolysinimonas sp.]|nr:NADP-dependent oxidoreductase [Pseudolysinimonas sp.]
MSRAVRFDQYGDSSVLKVVEVAERPPGAGEVRVAVSYAAINPGEIGIRAGLMHDRFPAHFPEGEGSDFAGTVVETGAGVTAVRVGDAVIGMSDGRNAHADSVTLPADRVVPKPAGLDDAVAASLYVAGTTAWVAVDAVAPRPGETVVVAGAAGGVGILATQLALRAGARVIATASEANHAFLAGLGAEPVAYGDGLGERIRALAPDGVDAFIDTHGDGNVAVAVALGVPRERIVTIADRAAAAEYGIRAVGMAMLADPAAAVSELARLLAAGELVLPIRARYPLERVAEAYDDLANRHGLGKIVLFTGTGKPTR